MKLASNIGTDRELRAASVEYLSSLPFDGRTLLVLRTSDDSEVKTSTANCENLDLGHHYRTPKALHSILKEFIFFLPKRC